MLVETFEDNLIERRRIHPGKVFLKDEIYGGGAAASRWQRAALEDFAARVGQQDFPCLFSRKAWTNGTVRFSFAECNTAREYDDVLVALTDYTNFVQSTPINERLFAPFVLFFEASRVDYVSLHSLGWDVLNWLHGMDSSPWPADVPAQPDHPDWCFCFNGVQLFINMSSPEHQTLRNRNLGRYLTFVINPRENFDAVASVHSRSGRLVRENIRRRVGAYNGGLVPEELGFYGDEDNREWWQYQLEEPGMARPTQCPFAHQHDMTTRHAMHSETRRECPAGDKLLALRSSEQQEN